MFEQAPLHDTRTTLDRLTVGAGGRVGAFSLRDGRGLELMEMGLTPGTPVSVARIAPFGGPIDIVVRGYHLSLRRSEAGQVVVIPFDGVDDA